MRDWIKKQQEILAAEIQREAEKAAIEEKNRRDIEAGRRAEEERRRAELNQDPAVQATLRRLDHEQAQAQQRARAEAEARQAEARADMEAEKARRLTLFMEAGGDPDDFSSVWAKMQEQIFLEKQNRRDEELRRASVF